MAAAVGPLRAVLLITKARSKPKLVENLHQGLSPFNGCFNLPARLMSTLLALVFISQSPLLAILADTQQGAALAQCLPGLIVEHIHLMGAAGDQAEALCFEASGQNLDILDFELDFNFAVGSHGVSVESLRALQRQRHSHSTANAERRHAPFGFAFQHFVEQSDGDSRSGAANGMSQGDGAAVDV